MPRSFEKKREPASGHLQTTVNFSQLPFGAIY